MVQELLKEATYTEW